MFRPIHFGFITVSFPPVSRCVVWWALFAIMAAVASSRWMLQCI